MRQGVAIDTANCCPYLAPQPALCSAELADVIAAWPTLPEPIKAGILAMVKAATGAGRD
jgi:hypothetical protein